MSQDDHPDERDKHLRGGERDKRSALGEDAPHAARSRDTVAAELAVGPRDVYGSNALDPAAMVLSREPDSK
jgi:hypothetical protein